MQTLIVLHFLFFFMQKCNEYVFYAGIMFHLSEWVQSDVYRKINHRRLLLCNIVWNFQFWPQRAYSFIFSFVPWYECGFSAGIMLQLSGWVLHHIFRNLNRRRLMFRCLDVCFLPFGSMISRQDEQMNKTKGQVKWIPDGLHNSFHAEAGVKARNKKVLHS